MGTALKFRNAEVPKQAGEFARLRVIRGPEAGVTYVLQSGTCVLGRGENCDVILQDVKSSRRHAEIRREQTGRWTVRDLGSSNGIVVSGRMTRDGVLESGTVFGIGETSFEFVTVEAGTQMLVAPPKAALMSLAEQQEFDRQRERVRSLAQSAPNVAAPVDPMATGRKKPSPLLLGTAAVGLVVMGFQLYADNVKKPKNASISALVEKCVNGQIRSDNLKSKVIAGVEERLKAERSASPFAEAAKKAGAAETTPASSTLTLPQIIDKCVAEVVDKKRTEKSTKDFERAARDLAGEALAGVPPEVARVADSLFKQGLREFQNGNFLRARQNFDTVLQMIPNHPLARIYVNHCTIELEDLVSRYLAAGKQKMDAGKLREARGHFEAVRRLLYQDQGNPDFIEAGEQVEAVDKLLKKGSSG